MTMRWLFTPENQARLVFPSLSAILLGIILTSPAQATVVYTNFGTGVCGGDATCISFNGINQNDEPVGGASQTFEVGNPEDTQSLANAFTSTGNFTLNDVMLPLDNIGFGNADVYLMTNSGGDPGTVLESWLNVAGQAFNATDQTDAITLTASGTPVTLGSGDEYWLVVTPAKSTSVVFWNYTWPGETAEELSTLYNPEGGSSGIPSITGPWFTNVHYNAFEIDGTPSGSGIPPVPEPRTFWFLLGTGLTVVAISRRRMKSV